MIIIKHRLGYQVVWAEEELGGDGYWTGASMAGEDGIANTGGGGGGGGGGTGNGGNGGSGVVIVKYFTVQYTTGRL